MSVNARTATAADFDKAAQENANNFWFCLLITAVVFWLWRGWAWLPGICAVWQIIRSVGCTNAANHLRKGTFTVPNPNNGAPDGDARNYQTDAGTT